MLNIRYMSILLLYFTVPTMSQENSVEQNNTADLSRQILPEEVKMLGTQSPFLVLQRESMTPSTKGTVLLIPDATGHAASAKHIDALRQQLNDYGWNTLAVMPPDIPETLNTDDAVQRYQTALQQRMSQVQQQAMQDAGSIVVIAQGSSAAVLNRLYVASALPEPAALILLGAYLPEDQQNRALARAIASHPIPTLDINHVQDNRFVRSQLQLRQKLANKLLKPVYRQRLITGSGYNTDVQQWVLQEIYGWLTSVGL